MFELALNLITQFQECECHFCGAALCYDASRAGQLVNCQSCGMETVMYNRGLEAPYPACEYLLEATNIGWSKATLGTRNVVGMIVNTSNRDLDWVRVEFTLINRQALPIGSTSDCLINFPADSIWRFQAPVGQREAVGVSAPLISCEFGKILPPPVAAQGYDSGRALMQRLVSDSGPGGVARQWSGIRIVPGGPLK